MNYESLQLVNYDGESIPSGYLFGDISAHWAITYLKSIGASDSAVAKIKEVEINKILYGIELLKSSADGVAYKVTNKQTGQVYGPGFQKPNQQATKEINKYTRGIANAKNWTVEPMEGGEAQPQQAIQQQPVQAKPKASKPAVKTTPKARKVTPETTSDITPKGKSSLEVSLEGKKPNIALNMLTLLKRYSPKQATALETFLLGGKGSKFVVDTEDVPYEIREEALAWALDPARNYMEVHEKLNRLSKVELEYSETLSDKISQRFGLSFSGDMESIFQGINFPEMVNKGVVAVHQLETIFPNLALAMRANMAANDSKELSEDFKLEKEMFVVPWDYKAEKVSSTLSTITEAITAKAMSFPQFIAKFTSGRQGNQGPSETGKTLAPLLNMILSEDSSSVVDFLGKRLGNVNSTDAQKENTLASIDTLRQYIVDRLSKGGDDIPTEDDLKSTSFTKLEKVLNLVSDADFPGNKEPLATLLVDMIVAVNKEVEQKRSDFKYTPVKLNGEPRGNLILEKVASLPTSDSDFESDSVKSKLQERMIKVFKAAQVISIAGFNGDEKESSFLLGKAGFEGAHSILEPWSGNFEPADFVGFMRTSPLLYDKSTGTIIFIDDNHEVKTLPMEATDKEKEEFASGVYQSLNKLIETDSIDSKRASYAMLAAARPELAKKFRNTPNSTSHLTDETAHKVYRGVGTSISSFITKMIDPIVGSRIQNGVGGPSITGKAQYQKFVEENPGIHLRAIEASMKGLKESAQFELELRGLVSESLGIEPDALRLAGKKPETKGEIGAQIVKSYMTLAKFQSTLQVLSDKDFVTTLVSGADEATIRQAMSGLIPGASPEFINGINLPDMSSFLNTVEGAFVGHADPDGKKKACIDFMVASITDGALREFQRKQDSKTDPLSASQLSEIFENISSVGNFVSQLSHPDYKGMKVFPQDENSKGGLDSLLETGSRLQLGTGETPTHRFTMGTRYSTEKGSHIDALNSRVSSEGGKRRLDLGFLEFKFVGGGTRYAHLLASSTPIRDIANALDDYDEISLDNVLNVTNSINEVESSNIFNIDWRCDVNSGTKVGKDGPMAHAKKGK